MKSKIDLSLAVVQCPHFLSVLADAGFSICDQVDKGL